MHLRPYQVGSLLARLLVASLVAFIAVWHACLPSHSAFAQTPDGVQVVENKTTYSFGGTLTFLARFVSSVPVQSAYVLFDAQGDTRTEPVQLTISPEGRVSGDYDLAAHPLRAFSRVSYRFHLSLADGTAETTPSYTFFYIDNRFNWQSLDEGPFTVHWYEGDLAMAQDALDIAQAGLEQVQSLLNTATLNGHIQFYIYASSVDLEAVLDPGISGWLAGHADPELDVALVSLPPGPDQHVLMEQRIPHELMHILLYQSTGLNSKDLPVWLNEGLASAAELYPNPDYQVLLANAYQTGKILPMSSLCAGFPRDASNAILAYAQSASFTRYLHATYGISGLNTLIANYSNGLSCSQGLQSALGKPMQQIERQWRQQVFAENSLSSGLLSLAPWLAVLLSVLLGPLAMLAALARRRFPPRRETSLANRQV